MRVAIGPSSFGEADPAPLNLLRERSIEIISNPFGRRLTQPELEAHIVGADGLIAGLEPLNAEVLARAGSLKAIARVGVGLDNVDLKAADRFNISVSNTPGAPVNAVAELTVSMMIALSRAVPSVNHQLHSGHWKKSIGKSLSETLVLIVGYGQIGHRVVELLEPFGPRILVCDPMIGSTASTPSCDLESGVRQADIISVHASGADTILDGHLFETMKTGCIVLSSGRGGQIDEEALRAALDQGIVSGAWLDVFSDEPYTGPLVDYPQVVLTPHMATYTRETRLSMELEATRNLIRDLSRDTRG